MKTAAIQLANMKIIGPEDIGSISVGGDYGDARYHILVNRDTFEPVDDTLYKCPTEGRAKYLKQSRGVGLKIVPQLLAAIPDLLPAFGVWCEKRRAERKAAHKKGSLENGLRVRGLDLLAACKQILADWDAVGTDELVPESINNTDHWDALRSVIEEIEACP